MHKCVRCGRAATSLQEINDGCPCGSKVFVFNKDAVDGIAGENVKAGGSDIGVAQAVELKPENGGATAPAQLPEPKTTGKEEGNGKAPESYHARMTFSSEDVENIKVLTEGVFVLSIQSLYRDPVVLKDEEGIYYVKLPVKQDGKKFDTGAEEGNGTEKK